MVQTFMRSCFVSLALFVEDSGGYAVLTKWCPRPLFQQHATVGQVKSELS